MFDRVKSWLATRRINKLQADICTTVGHDWDKLAPALGFTSRCYRCGEGTMKWISGIDYARAEREIAAIYLDKKVDEKLGEDFFG